MTIGSRLQLYPLFRVAVVLILGIIVGEALIAAIAPVAWIAATGMTVCVSLFLFDRPIIQSILLLLSIFFVGAWIVSVKESEANVGLPEGKQRYAAVVASTPVECGKVVMCDLIVASGALQGRKLKASILRDTLACRYSLLRVGTGVMAESEFESANDNADKSNFDYSRWMKVQGYAARTFIYYDSWQPCEVSLSMLSHMQRARLGAMKIRECMLREYRSEDAGSQTYAVVAAMTLGDKTALSRETKDTYSVTGASHVLALSGLHIGIIYVILSSIICRRRWRLLGQIVVVLAIWLYVLIVGMSASVVRAASMFTVYAMVSLLDRNRKSLNTLSLAAVVMLVCNPMSLWDVGFQMSFLAVLSILLFYSRIYNIANNSVFMRIVPLRWLWATVAVAVAAQIGVAPLVMYYFGRFSCYFLITNIVAVPLATVVIYCAFLMFLSSPFPLIQGWLSSVLFAAASLLNNFLTFVSGLPGASIENISINGWQLLIIYVFIASLYGIACYVEKMLRSSRIIS